MTEEELAAANAEDTPIETVTIEDKKNVAPQDHGKYTGPSAWQTALGYALPIAAVAGGPIGLAVGGLFGLASHLRKNAWLDAEQRASASIQENTNEYQKVWQREFDEAEAAGDQMQMDVLKDLETQRVMGLNAYNGGNPNGMTEMYGAMNKVLGISSAQIAERKQREAQQFEVERGFVTTGANNLRTEYKGTLDIYDESELMTNKITTMLKDAKDVDAPQTRAMLTDMVGLMASAGYRDQRDALDALTEGVKASSSGGLVGDVIRTGVDIGTALYKTSKNWDKETWYRVSYNFQNAMKKSTAAKLERIQGDADKMQLLSQNRKITSEGFDIRDYIYGGKDEIDLTPTPYAPTTAEVQKAMPEMKPPVTANMNFGNSKSFSPLQYQGVERERYLRMRRRPTN